MELENIKTQTDNQFVFHTFSFGVAFWLYITLMVTYYFVKCARLDENKVN